MIIISVGTLHSLVAVAVAGPSLALILVKIAKAICCVHDAGVRPNTPVSCNLHASYYDVKGIIVMTPNHPYSWLYVL